MSQIVVWTMVHPGIGKRTVSGFLHVKSARKHVIKHYLDPRENWSELGPEPLPSAVNRDLQDVGSSRTDHLAALNSSKRATDILDHAAKGYEECVRESTTEDKIMESARVIRQDDDYPTQFVERYIVGSSAGIFSAFIPGDMSHLATAYRPSAMEGSGKTRLERRVQAVLRKIANEVSRSEFFKRWVATDGTR